MEDLLLEIDNIDYKATANNVKNFLENKLPCILRLANSSPASLASPVISDMPVNRGGGNYSEEKMVKYVAAEQSSMGYHERLRIVPRRHPTSSKNDMLQAWRTGK